MLSLLMLTTLPLATAQDRGVRVDPGYLEYLEQLGELDELDFATGPQPELFDGIVTLIDDQGFGAGQIFVSGNMPVKQEIWFMVDAPDPGAEFGFQHNGPFAQEEVIPLLEAWDPGWESHPCYRQTISYKQLPNKTLTASLDYEPNIDRYHFVLWQGGEVVGRMLREHHHVPDMPEKIVEHWGFFAWYAFPDEQDDGMWAQLSPNQFATTTAFFDSLQLDADIWLAFAQIQYQELTGLQCLAVLNP